MNRPGKLVKKPAYAEPLHRDKIDVEKRSDLQLSR